MSPSNGNINSVFQVGERTSLALARNSCVVQFMSSTAAVRQIAQQTNADIAPTVDGYYNDLVAFSAVAYTYATWAAALNGDTFWLRPISDLTRLSSAKRARLTGYQFRAYDFSATAATTGNGVIGQEVGGWQPNFARFQIQTGNNESVITGDIKGIYFPGTNAGDQSIGLSVPFCADTNLFMNDGTGGVANFAVYAPCGKITGVDSVQAYPVLATLYFVLNEI